MDSEWEATQPARGWGTYENIGHRGAYWWIGDRDSGRRYCQWLALLPDFNVRVYRKLDHLLLCAGLTLALCSVIPAWPAAIVVAVGGVYHCRSTWRDSVACVSGALAMAYALQ